MRSRWTPVFRVGVLGWIPIVLLTAGGGFATLVALAALTRLVPQLDAGFVGALLPGALLFAIGFRFRMLNVYVGDDGVLVRSMLSTRLLPWDTIAIVESVSVNGAFGDRAGSEVWFTLTDGSAVDTPVCRTGWDRRTGLVRNVRNRDDYEDGFDRLHAIVLERAAGEIAKPAAEPPPATHRSAGQPPSWAKPVNRD